MRPKRAARLFFENASIKARALFDATGQPALADDSGLCVDALGGAPGVHSARFGNEGGAALTDAQRNALLLSKMKGEAMRTCRFVCCLVLYLGEGRFVAAQETLEGVLLDEPRGAGGFGYDPVVFLPELGKSVAELSAEEKNRVSHRAKAASRLRLLAGCGRKWAHAQTIMPIWKASANWLLRSPHQAWSISTYYWRKATG